MTPMFGQDLKKFVFGKQGGCTKMYLQMLYIGESLKQWYDIGKTIDLI